MTAINNLVAESLNEPIEIPRGLFRARNPENKVRPRDLAFKAVYGRFPVTELRNVPYAEQNIDTDILDQLGNIPNIIMRTFCEGYDKDNVAYVVFIPNIPKESYVIKIVDKLKKIPGIYPIYDRGNQGKYRICIAGKVWFHKDKDNSSWEEWWKQLPSIIKWAVK